MPCDYLFKCQKWFLVAISFKEQGDESEVKLGLLFGCCGFR